MPLVCLGLSHHTAPVEVRERHAFPASRMSETLIALRDYEAIHEAVMLSTCNRLEIYAEVADAEIGIAQLKAFLQNFRHGAVSDLDSYLYTLVGIEAVGHLFRVATGLDSMFIGEAEILGQLKDAYVAAQHARSLDKTLHTLFREALQIGKRARSRTAIADESVSVATAAVELARRTVESLDGADVLVVGAGKMGTLAARRFREVGAGTIRVANRSPQRALELTGAIGRGTVVSITELPAAIAASDIVLASAGASHFVLTKDIVAEAIVGRTRPLLIVDIAVPRDVDPDVASLPNVTVADIDALQSVVESTLERRRAAIPHVEVFIREHVARFERWYATRLAVPTISSLVRKADRLREQELDRLFARCPDLTERERLLVTGTTMTITSKMLHGAIMKIRETATVDREAAARQAAMLRELFDLDAVEIEDAEPVANAHIVRLTDTHVPARG